MMTEITIPEHTQTLRKAILDAATHLFLERGYHGVGMREIARDSGASKALLYYHFSSKADLFYEILVTYIQALGELVEGAMNEQNTPRRQLEYIFRGMMAWSVEQRAMIYLAKQEVRHLDPNLRENFLRQYHDRFIGQVQKIFKEGCDQGIFRQIDSRLAAQLLLAMAAPVLSIDWPKSEMESDIGSVLQVFFDGIQSNERENPENRSGL